MIICGFKDLQCIYTLCVKEFLTPILGLGGVDASTTPAKILSGEINNAFLHSVIRVPSGTILTKVEASNVFVQMCTTYLVYTEAKTLLQYNMCDIKHGAISQLPIIVMLCIKSLAW